jgi:phytoene dehydrogenase-like protein
MEKSKWQAGQFATFKLFPTWLQFLMSQLLCSSTYMKYASRTTEQVLGEMTDDGRLKTVLSAFGGDLGESTISGGSFVMQAAVLGHVLEGCHFPQGGPIQFVRGLVPTIRQAGGEVLVKARVEEIF